MRARTRSRLFVVGLLVLGLVTPGWNLALTTFGKSNPQNNNNNNNNDRPPGIQARECTTNQDCSAIGGTMCLETLSSKDNKMRCLCTDYKEPRNGHCDNQYRGVKVLCSSTDECTAGAHCTMSNITSLPGKRCFCMNGYDVEDDMTCSGSPAAFGFSALSLVASLLIAGSV